jgi:hypothetical protein
VLCSVCRLGVGFNLSAGQVNQGPAELANVRLCSVCRAHRNVLLFFPLHGLPSFPLKWVARLQLSVGNYELQACNRQ